MYYLFTLLGLFTWYEFVRRYRRYETRKLFSADVTKWSHRSDGRVADRRPTSSNLVDSPLFLYLANLAMLAICSKKLGEICVLNLIIFSG